MNPEQIEIAAGNLLVVQQKRGANVCYNTLAMVINNYGLDFFKLKYGDTTIGINPPAEDSDLESKRFGADIALSSIRHPDYDGGALLTGGDKEPVIVNGPGEYEIGGISVDGIASEAEYDGSEYINTIYVFRMQDMDICFVGPIAGKDLPPGAQELMESIDILFVPIGDDSTLEPADAYKLAVQIEPSIVVPTHFTDPETENLEKLVNESGQDDVQRTDKLTISPRDLSGRDTEVTIIRPDT